MKKLHNEKLHTFLSSPKYYLGAQIKKEVLCETGSKHGRDEK
jgi:hypothetical protein